MAIASFGPTATVAVEATSTSAATALPTSGTPTIALVSNISASTVFAALGSSSSVTATVTGSVPILPMSQLALTIGANTYIALISESVAGVNITVGN